MRKSEISAKANDGDTSNLTTNDASSVTSEVDDSQGTTTTDEETVLSESIEAAVHSSADVEATADIKEDGSTAENDNKRSEGPGSLSPVRVKASNTVKLSKLTEMIERQDKFLSEIFWILVITIGFVRISTILYLWYNVYHYVISQWIIENYVVLKHSSSTVVAIPLLLLISLLHVSGLIEMAHSINIYLENETAVERRNSSRERGTFSSLLSSKLVMIQEQRSKRFGISILKRFGTLLLRTRKAYMNAELIPNRGYIILYLCCLVVNCVVTPSFLMSNNKYVNIIAAEFVDSCFDVYFSLLLPVQFFISGEIQSAEKTIGQASNWESIVTEHVTSNVMQIDSVERIFVFLTPFVLYHFGLKKVLMNTAITIVEYREKKKLAVEIEADSKTIETRTPSDLISHGLSEKFNTLKPMLLSNFDGTNTRNRKIAVVVACVYAVLIATISGFAIFQDACPSECKVPLINMLSFSNSCRCLAWTVNCKKLDLMTIDSVNAHVAVIPQDTTVLRFHECPIDDVPQALYPRFKDLLTMEFYDTQLTKFSFDLKTNFEKLRAFSIVKSPMVSVPEGLLSHPVYLNEIRISRTLLNWQEAFNIGRNRGLWRLYLQYNNFTEVPNTSTFSLVPVISVSGNPISDLNTNLINHGVTHLLALDMNLTVVNPKLLVALPILTEVHFENNNIVEIPESVQLDMLEKWSVIGLTHNPVCESPGKLLPELYERACTQEMCDPACLEKFDLKNSQCDVECNVEACGFDGGDCEL